jgi:DNA-binding transcriptional ArsR family regulator
MERRILTLTGRTLRCLAHPLRLRLLGMLRTDGPATATGLAKRTGENSANVSWHLRQLAEAGFVEEDAERGNRRDRWWRSVYDSTDLNTPEVLTDPTLSGPMSVYLHELNAQQFEAASTAIAELPAWPREWKLSADLSDFDLSLTAAEAATLRERLHEVIEEFRRQPEPADTKVTVQVSVLPRDLGPQPR